MRDICRPAADLLVIMGRFRYGLTKLFTEVDIGASSLRASLQCGARGSRGVEVGQMKDNGGDRLDVVFYMYLFCSDCVQAFVVCSVMIETVRMYAVSRACIMTDGADWSDGGELTVQAGVWQNRRVRRHALGEAPKIVRHRPDIRLSSNQPIPSNTRCLSLNSPLSPLTFSFTNRPKMLFRLTVGIPLRAAWRVHQRHRHDMRQNDECTESEIGPRGFSTPRNENRQITKLWARRARNRQRARPHRPRRHYASGIARDAVIMLEIAGNGVAGRHSGI